MVHSVLMLTSINNNFRDRDGNPRERVHNNIQAFVAVFETTIKMSILKPLSLHYDIFISYSHRNTEKARAVLDFLQAVTKSRELSIFFDKEELKMGKLSNRRERGRTDVLEVRVVKKRTTLH